MTPKDYPLQESHLDLTQKEVRGDVMKVFYVAPIEDLGRVCVMDVAQLKAMFENEVCLAFMETAPTGCFCEKQSPHEDKDEDPYRITVGNMSRCEFTELEEFEGW